MKKAFTLVELLVVMTIIGALAALAAPIYRRAIQSSRATACLSNLRQLGAALNLYLGDHNLIMPVMMAGRDSKTEDVPVIDNVLNVYVPDARVFACPADGGNIAGRSGTSYYWNSALNGQSLPRLNLFDNTTVSTIPVLSDKEGFHPYTPNHVNILNADSHVSQGLNFSPKS